MRPAEDPKIDRSKHGGDQSRRWRGLGGLLLLATTAAPGATASLAGEAADGARGPAISTAAPFCAPESREANGLDSADGQLVELMGRVFRTCDRVDGPPGFFFISANPDALPWLRFPDMLDEITVMSPFSPVPLYEWTMDMRTSTRTPEGALIERRADRVIGNVVYEQYLLYGFLRDGSMDPGFVSFHPVPGSDAPDHLFGCTGPIVGIPDRTGSYCWMYLRYRGLYATIGWSDTKEFPGPIPIGQFDAYARDLLHVLTATDVTGRVGEFPNLDQTVLDLGPFLLPTLN